MSPPITERPIGTLTEKSIKLQFLCLIQFCRNIFKLHELIMKLKTDNNNILYCWKSQLCQTLLLQWRKISIGFNPFTGPTKPTKSVPILLLGNCLGKTLPVDHFYKSSPYLLNGTCFSSPETEFISMIRHFFSQVLVKIGFLSKLQCWLFHFSKETCFGH